MKMVSLDQKQNWQKKNQQILYTYKNSYLYQIATEKYLVWQEILRKMAKKNK